MSRQSRLTSESLFRICTALAILLAACGRSAAQDGLTWAELPELPNPSGVAGPFVGVSHGGLIVAGGANFPSPVWDNNKVWHDDIFVMTGTVERAAWKSAGKLPHPIAYGASVTSEIGLIAIGGHDGLRTQSRVGLMQWDAKTGRIELDSLPDLPHPMAYGAAAIVGNTVYFVGGQHDSGLDSATTDFWGLDLSKRDQAAEFHWYEPAGFPGPSRAFHVATSQHNGYENCIYVIGGRRQTAEGEVEFLSDIWEYSPQRNRWRSRSDAPHPTMAGTAIGLGQSHIVVLGGADGSLFTQADSLRDDHPGFPRRVLRYHTITDRWVVAGSSPMNQVTTTAIRWDGQIVVPSGEVRPRVRTPKVWSIKAKAQSESFGFVNYSVLVVYLLAMLCIGLWFTGRNTSTDDYFRAAKRIPWWAAGCSIFATMLSSLTFTGIPSKAFAQDWVYAIGNFTIPLVAFVAVYVAMPFFRRLDVTSAYEYLEQRFSRGVRLFGSTSFCLFHVFRMAVVMSLTGLALAVATPLGPIQSVLIMGILSIAYCTMGGIEAVIWTDTIQTVVLLGGALLAFTLLIAGVDGGWSGFQQTGLEHEKFRIANFHLDATAQQIALWAIILGGIAQNLSSYTADQAVVQRYMTTADERLAAKSIWTNALMTIPATILFFGIGSALFSFYHSHPEKLDASITTDQIFPMFISREMPVGIAGLIVAGIFAAAQSTVSTSMNSTATAIVTDFLRPAGVGKSENAYLAIARWVTLGIGVSGTALAMVFVDPGIKSLFDTFIAVIGLFMGVLGGLFVLGGLTRRATASGALTGAFVGAAVMAWLWLATSVNGYLYTAAGIATCVIVGYLSSFVLPAKRQDLQGLTVYDL